MFKISKNFLKIINITLLVTILFVFISCDAFQLFSKNEYMALRENKEIIIRNIFEKSSYNIPIADECYISGYNGGEGYDGGIRFVDLNGDGLVDIIRSFRRDEDSVINNTWLNTGTGWKEDINYKFPSLHDGYYITKYHKGASIDGGVRFVDLNGDGLVDIIRSFRWNDSDVYNNSWINTGSGWTESINYKFPSIHNGYYISRYNNGIGIDGGVRFVDLNCDGLVDMIRSFRWNDSDVYNNSWLNTGTGWQENNSYIIPGDNGFYISRYIDGIGIDGGIRFIELNGDGKIDLIRSFRFGSNGVVNNAWINTGSGWQENSNYEIPSPHDGCYISRYTGVIGYDGGIRFADLNGDGLNDILRSFLFGDENVQNNVWLNTGSGWQENSDYIIPALHDGYYISRYSSGTGFDGGIRLVDLNGDGLTDLIRSFRMGDSDVGNDAWINTGNGWKISNIYEIPSNNGYYISRFNNGFGFDGGIRFVDLNGDKLIDIVQSLNWQDDVVINNIWLNTTE